MYPMYFIFGGVIITASLLDFLYTTLSFNGSGKLTSSLNLFLQKTIKPAFTKKWLGLIHLVMNLWLWILLVLLGGFFVFAGSADMVVNAQTKTPATLVERIYYTVFVFSTLGNGDFVPGNNFSMIFTPFYSVIGFGVLTIGISYLLSVTNAALVKKNLATFISSMGQSPSRLYRFFNSNGNAKQFLKRIDDLVQLIDTHANNHLAFPIVHYFLTSDRKRAAAIHLSSLYETTRILRMKFRGNDEIMGELKRVETSIMNFLELSHRRQYKAAENLDVKKFRKIWKTLEPAYTKETDVKDDLTPRLSDLLYSQGWQWKDVYMENEK